jgi:hypothetical protein
MMNTLEVLCITEVIIEVRVSVRSGVDMGKAAHGSWDVPMDMAMKMAMAVTHFPAETAYKDTLEAMERTKNAKRRRRSVVLLTVWPIGD